MKIILGQKVLTGTYLVYAGGTGVGITILAVLPRIPTVGAVLDLSARDGISEGIIYDNLNYSSMCCWCK